MCLWAVLPFRPMVNRAAMLPGAAYDRCSHFRTPELPFPDRIRWDASNMSALTLIYLLIRSKEVDLFFITNVNVRFLDYIAKWRYKIGLNELSCINKPIEIETDKWTLHVEKREIRNRKKMRPTWKRLIDDNNDDDDNDAGKGHE
jgi:hypothetical protein